jgi:UDP-N-acetylmuramate dehydrogenase
MFTFSENLSLKSYNTFGIPVNARYFLSIEAPGDLKNFFSQHPELLKEEILVLGGGSNLLFLHDFRGLVIYPQIEGIKTLSESEEEVKIEAGAGENWDDFVNKCVAEGWGGVENLSLIPGNVGAVPVQNIGAYGVEAESVILKVNAINLKDFSFRCFSNSECQFGYRKSIFKNELKNQYLITSVVFRLKKNAELNYSYGALETELNATGTYTLKGLRQAVIAVRESKLPDPKVIGNAGSFFKNPVITADLGKGLKQQYPGIPLYACENGRFKISAGWLIEQAGWKGKSLGNAAVHDKQALVLVNKGNATGSEILELSHLIRGDIFSKFGIQLEPEVNIFGDQISD